MVAKITTPARLLSAVFYNENKVAKNKAICIHANGFLWEHNEMSLDQKAGGLQRLADRNERAKTKTLHVSLNFDPSEKLSIEQLVSIGNTYMQMLGFGEQPYLVYRHQDAGHPHIHIVSTTIREDGSRINTHNIGRNQSEKARKEIEQTYGLVVAENKKKTITAASAPTLRNIQYGKTETKKAIEEAVSFVMHQYAFSSLHTFNAVLRKSGVEATAGKEDSRTHQHKGLYYRMLNSNKRPVGVPIKASLLACKPTLVNLEIKFAQNAAFIHQYKPQIKQLIDRALARQPRDIDQLTQYLKEQFVETIFHRSADGRIYGITFIDERNKAVINGSEIGKAYSAAHLFKRLDNTTTKVHDEPVLKEVISHTGLTNPDHLSRELNMLIEPTHEYNPIPGPLKKKRKRKNKYLGL